MIALPNAALPVADKDGRITRDFMRWLQDALSHIAERLIPTGVKTAAYTASAWDFVECDPTAGGFTVTLPPIVHGGEQVVVKNASASANVITIEPAANNTIDNGASTTIAVGRGALLFNAGHNTLDWRVT